MQGTNVTLERSKQGGTVLSTNLQIKLSFLNMKVDDWPESW